MDKSQEYDDRYKKNPQKWNIPDRDNFALEVIKWHIEKPTNILDIGCGNGHTLELLAKEFPEAELTGLEISKEAIALASSKVPKAKFVEKYLENYTSRIKFDLIINLGTIEHIEDLDQSLINLKKLLKQDGIIYFEAPDNLVYSPGDHSFRRLRIGSKQVEWHLTRWEWETKFEKANLEIVNSYYGQKLSWRNIWVLK